MKAATIFFWGCMTGGVAVAGGMYLAHINGVEARSPFQRTAEVQAVATQHLPQPPNDIQAAVREHAKMIRQLNEDRRNEKINERQYQEWVAGLAATSFLMRDQGKYDMEWSIATVASAIDAEYKFDVESKIKEMREAGKF